MIMFIQSWGVIDVKHLILSCNLWTHSRMSKIFKFHFVVMPPKAKPKRKTKMSKKPIPKDCESSSSSEKTKVVKIH